MENHFWQDSYQRINQLLKTDGSLFPMYREVGNQIPLEFGISTKIRRTFNSLLDPQLQVIMIGSALPLQPTK